MKKNPLAIIAIALFVAVAFTSCETATGQGAGWGAATGAILGGLTSRHHSVEGAAVGALIGANTGALIGASIDEAHAVRYGPRPRGGFPFAEPTETPGLYVSPYPPHRVYNLRHVPPGGLVEDEVGGGYFRKP
ncbi:MAG TPA: glycine zipper domain-containing protein [Chthoniobacterales bacterium]|jgi:predicted small secreted protein|nr:glycine zipper domain-containing protein [Chthoniobacterales bacterium]